MTDNNINENVNGENIQNPPKKRRRRRTREERMQELQRKLERMQMQASGEFVPQDDPTGEKTVRRALKKRQTAIRNAQELIDGKPNPEKPGKYLANPIDIKIENKERQLRNLYAERDEANRQLAELPVDISRLESLVERVESGETVELPEDLHPIRSGEAEDVDADEPDAIFND